MYLAYAITLLHRSGYSFTTLRDANDAWQRVSFVRIRARVRCNRCTICVHQCNRCTICVQQCNRCTICVHQCNRCTICVQQCNRCTICVHQCNRCTIYVMVRIIDLRSSFVRKPPTRLRGILRAFLSKHYAMQQRVMQCHLRVRTRASMAPLDCLNSLANSRAHPWRPSIV